VPENKPNVYSVVLFH